MPTSTDRTSALTFQVAPARSLLRMAEIDELDREEFIARFGFLFEDSPWIAASAWETRPWGTREVLHGALCRIVAETSEEQQLTLIRAHPDLVGRAALTGTLSRESTAEQRAAGLDPEALTPDEIARFAAANAAYRERFGFPFVICARENRKASILAGLDERLNNERKTEVGTALREIERIAWYRLVDVVEDDAKNSTTEVTMAGDYAFDISYGKQGVPVYRVFATPLRNVKPIPESAFTGRDNNLLACEVDVEVFGDEFLPAYTEGDNSMVVATDSMKNFIIRESLSYPGATLEGLLYHLGAGFATTYSQLHTIAVRGRELPFVAAVVPDGGGGFGRGGNLFRHERGDRAFASVSLERSDDGVTVTGHHCGIAEIELMKLTGSAFTSFVRDDYTTLPERGDRPLYTRMNVEWGYTDPTDMLNTDRGYYVPVEQLRDLLMVTFDEFVSESIQHLLYEMGRRVLERFPQLAWIGFDAQNRTRDPYGQRDDDPRVKVYSDPFPAYGRLTLTMRRAN